MANKSISVLGSGWLGMPLIKTLVELNYDVKASTRTVDKLPSLQTLGATPYIFDLQSQSNENSFLQSDILLINVPNKDLAAYQSLLRHVELSPIQHALLISSTAVYSSSDSAITEQYGELNQNNPWYAIERLFLECKTLSNSVIRFAGLIGPKRHPGRFFKAHSVVKHAQSPVNLIHLDDCIGIICALLGQGAWSQVFNGCADTHPSKETFYRAACQHVGSITPAFEDGAVGKLVDNSKVKSQLNYQFSYPDVIDALAYLK